VVYWSHTERRETNHTLPGQDLPSPEEVFGVNPLSTDNSILIDGQIITDRGNLITDNDDLITDNELEIGSDMNDAFGHS
jgi:hypothetical protein